VFLKSGARQKIEKRIMGYILHYICPKIFLAAQKNFSLYFDLNTHIAFYKQHLEMNIIANIFTLLIAMNPHSFNLS
jgi:hypothetical protein